MMSADLFNQTAADWGADPITAFDAWLSSQDYKRSSADVYRALWGRFLAWLEDRRIALEQVETTTMVEFLCALEAKREHRARYLRIIERVFDQARRAQLGTANPARGSALVADPKWKRTKANDPTGFLDEHERSKLIASLVARPDEPLSGAALWRQARDRALTAIFLGAGLKLAEASTLELRTVDVGQEWIIVESADGKYSRRARMLEPLKAVLLAWLTIRREAGSRGTLVFPATCKGAVMHKATILRAIDAQVERADLGRSAGAKIGPQVLRNAYAAILFDASQPPELVCERLGLARAQSGERLRASWEAWRATRT